MRSFIDRLGRHPVAPFAFQYAVLEIRKQH